MGRVLVLSLLLGLMWLLRTLPGQSDGTHDPLVLAAIGFVVMASYTAAEIGSALSLPRVSGYIAAGLLLGPSAGQILTDRVVQDLTMFNTLALGLIATGAGLELDVKQLRALLRTLGATVGLKIVLAGGLVFACFVGVELLWHPLGLPTTGSVIAAGLVLGTLAVGTSPAITLAVINETGARGRLADLTLGAAVVKDLVLVVLLAVSIAVGTGLVGHAGGHGSIGATLARELGGSVAVGAVLGAIIIVYMRFIAAEMLLFVAGLVLGAAEISRMLHLDLLLVFIAAGFVVRNYSHVWEEVLHALETVSLPVFVVFFTIAGARIDLQATLTLLPVALCLSLVRAGAFYASARLGGMAGGESERVRRLAWQAYLPQAGVTLGLLGLAVEALGEEVGGPLSDIGVACVALNLAVGPVLQRRALQQSVADEAADTEAPSDPAVPSSRPPSALVIDTGDATLDHRLQVLHEALLDAVRDICRDTLRARAVATTDALTDVFEAPHDSARLQRLLAWVASDDTEAHARLARDRALLAQTALMAPIAALPMRVRAPLLPDAIAAAPGDAFDVAWRKRRARLRRRLAGRLRDRQIPLRTAAQAALLPRTHALAEQVLALLGRQRLRVLSTLRELACGDLEIEDAAERISEHLEHAERAFQSDAQVALTAGMRELVRISAEIDGPVRPLSTLRYSEVEPEVRERARRLRSWGQDYEAMLVAVEQEVRAAASLSRLGLGAERALEQIVLMPLAEAVEAIEPAVARMRSQLNEALAWVRDPERDPALLDEMQRALRTTAAGRQGASEFRAAAALHHVAVELRALIDALPSELRLVSGGAPSETVDPSRVSFRNLDLVERAQQELIQEFMRELDLEGRRAASSVQELDARVQDAVAMAQTVFDAMAEGAEGHADDDTGAADDTLSLALRNLEEGTAQARAQLIDGHDAIAAAFQATLARLQDGLRTASDLGTAGKALRRPLRQAWLNTRARFAALWARVVRAQDWLVGTDIAHRLVAPPRTPQALRDVLSRRVESELPSSYRRLFRLEPDQDMRHSVGHRAEFEQLMQAQDAWARGATSSVLVLGDPGSGRTTLMNAAQIEVTAERMLRPEAVRSRRREGLVRALAYELRCAPRRRTVIEALRARPSAVLVDDLEHWIPADEGASDGLRSLLSMVRQTRREVFWIVSCGSAFAELIRDVEPIDRSFGHVVTLEPLTLPELRRAIELRHSLSGMEVVFPRVLGRLPSRLIRDSDSDLVFRILHSMSGGNPSGAFGLWLNSVRVDNRRVHLMLEQLVGQQLQFGTAFDSLATAILVQLHRFGPLTSAELAASLGVDVARLHAPILALRNASVLPDGGGKLQVVPHLRALLSSRLSSRARWRH